MPRTVECGTGLKVVVRGVSGRQADRMVDPTNASDVYKLIRDCTVEVLDGGIYPVPFKWDDVFGQDRFQVLLHVSSLTYGDFYPFTLACDSCRKPFSWVVELSKLPVKAWPEKTLAALAAGQNRFSETARLGSADYDDGEDKKVVYRYLTEKMEVAALKETETKVKRKYTTQFKASMLEIAGLADQALDIPRMLENSNHGRLEELRERIGDNSGGVETKLLLTCSQCGWEQDRDLPLARLLGPRDRKILRSWQDLEAQ